LLKKGGVTYGKLNNLGYYRYTTYEVEEILKLIGDYNKEEDVELRAEKHKEDVKLGKQGDKKYTGRVTYKGDKFKVTSYRLLTFLYKGTKCVECGVEGKFFSLDNTKIGDSKHINLIGVDTNGEEVLMTSDHIYPKSLGGSDKINNRQTMCDKCNVEKWHQVIK